MAHVLAEEIGHNLQYAAGQRLNLNRNPKGIPADFFLSVAVYHSVLPRIGELPKHVGEVVLLYRQFESLNELPKPFGEALERYHSPDGQPATLLVRLKEEMNGYLGVYRTGLEDAVNRANTILPKLRSAAVPWYRIDMRMRKPTLLSTEDLNVRVNRLADSREAQRQSLDSDSPTGA